MTIASRDGVLRRFSHGAVREVLREEFAKRARSRPCLPLVYQKAVLR